MRVRSRGRFGAEHHEVVVTPRRLLRRACPTSSGTRTSRSRFRPASRSTSCRRLAEQHVKVVLTGEGADELFLGYNRYRVTAWNERLGRAYRACTSRRLRSTLRSAHRVDCRGRFAATPERTFLGARHGIRAICSSRTSRSFPNGCKRRAAVERRIRARRSVRLCHRALPGNRRRVARPDGPRRSPDLPAASS